MAHRGLLLRVVLDEAHCMCPGLDFRQGPHPSAPSSMFAWPALAHCSAVKPTVDMSLRKQFVQARVPLCCGHSVAWLAGRLDGSIGDSWPGVPYMALSATAMPFMLQDILQCMCSHVNPRGLHTLRVSCFRNNLHSSVLGKMPAMQQDAQLLQQIHAQFLHSTAQHNALCHTRCHHAHCCHAATGRPLCHPSPCCSLSTTGCRRAMLLHHL